MPEANIPCRNPSICKVQSHRPGTQSKCLRGKSSADTAKNNQSSIATTPSLASGRGTGVRGLIAVGMGAFFDEDEEYPTAVGHEKVSAAQYEDRDALRIDSGGGHSGYLVIENEAGASRGVYGSGTVILVSDWQNNAIGPDSSFETVGQPIYKNSDGELWMESQGIPGHHYGTPIKLSTLKVGDRHWVQDEDEESGYGEYASYELARRAIANPETSAWLHANAPVSDPEIDVRWQTDADSLYFSPDSIS